MATVDLWGAEYSNVPAVDLPNGGGGTTRFHEVTGNIDIDDSGVFDVTQYATATVPELEYEAHHQISYRTQDSQRRCDIEAWSSADEPGFWSGGNIIAMDTWLPAVAANTTITPTESAQTVGGSDYMMEGAVTVSGIPSNYVGSGVTQRSSSDLTASGATVTAPAGYYASNATKTVASGTAGTPTATKGTVSNHSVSVTPSVTNTTGYITGSTKTGTAVTVSASELVSGTLNVTSSGTKDVTNYASASIPAGTEGTPTATKGTVANNSVTVTPSVTNTAGYVSGGTHTGTAVTVTASELVSGSQTITTNGTYDVTTLASIVAAIESGGGGIVTENIIPQQTLNCSIDLGDGAYGAIINTYTEYPIDGTEYIVTFDGTAYIARGHYRTSSVLVVGDYYVTAGATYVEFPFAIILSGGTLFYLAVQGSGTHTFKVDKILSYSGGGGGGSTLIEKAITENGTYIASDDSADGYSKVTVDVPTPSSPWKHILTQDVTVNTTSTSAAAAATLQCGAEIATKDKIIWVRIRDKAGPRAGYCYGSDAFFVNYNKANGSTSAFAVPAVLCLRYTTSSAYAGTAGQYGVYGYSISNAGALIVRRRYNSNYSLTIDGTYQVDVYTLDLPDGLTLFE